MADDHARPALSQALTDALDRFRPFMVGDDAERESLLASADDATLVQLARAIRPLLDEINAVQDDLVAREHPLPGDLEDLEYAVGDLAQAGIEAALELEARGVSVPDA